MHKGAMIWEHSRDVRSWILCSCFDIAVVPRIARCVLIAGHAATDQDDATCSIQSRAEIILSYECG